MRVELPEFKRCCFCMPLRRGLLTWVYLKMVVSVVVVGLLTPSLILYTQLLNRISISIVLILSIFEIAFSILFVVRVHKKNHLHLRIYYRYAIAVLIIEILALLGQIAIDINKLVNHMVFFMIFYDVMLLFTGLIAIQIVVQFYFILLVRSEMRKLEANTKFQFVNHLTQPACTAEVVA